MKKKDWSNMSVAELRGVAAGLGVSVKKKMRKADIIDAISGSSLAPPSKNPGHVAKPKKTGRVARPVAAPGPAPAQERAHGAPGADMQQAVEESKYYTGQPEAPFPLPSELPHGYGDNQITLMARDPYWAFTYWEVTPKRLEAERLGLGSGGSDASLALRLYDVTEVMFDGRNDHGHYDIGVYERVGSWFINTGMPDRSFIVDLGLKTHDGRFVTLARSNAVKTPRDGPSSVTDEEWVLPERDFERIFALSGGLDTGLSSADVRLRSAQRIPFGMASPGMGSLALMSPMRKERQRGFWFVLNTELIVYGATEPDAAVTVQGMPVALRPDGTFSLRFALPDGTQTIPVSATSSDKEETRWITPEVNRRTS
jgi:hypothetical protein